LYRSLHPNRRLLVSLRSYSGWIGENNGHGGGSGMRDVNDGNLRALVLSFDVVRRFSLVAYIRTKMLEASTKLGWGHT